MIPAMTDAISQTMSDVMGMGYTMTGTISQTMSYAMGMGYAMTCAMCYATTGDCSLFAAGGLNPGVICSIALGPGHRTASLD